jgi:hypothetical protein
MVRHVKALDSARRVVEILQAARNRNASPSDDQIIAAIEAGRRRASRTPQRQKELDNGE